MLPLNKLPHIIQLKFDNTLDFRLFLFFVLLLCMSLLRDFQKVGPHYRTARSENAYLILIMRVQYYSISL